MLSPETSQHGGGGYWIVDAAGKAHPGRTPAGAVCDSYHAQMHALRHAMRDLAAADCKIAVPPKPELRFCTDSQSAIKALQRGPWLQSTRLAQEVWAALQQLERRYRSLTKTWVFFKQGVSFKQGVFEKVDFQ